MLPGASPAEGLGSPAAQLSLGEARKRGSGQLRVTAHLNRKDLPGCGTSQAGRRSCAPRTGRWSWGPTLWGAFPARGLLAALKGTKARVAPVVREGHTSERQLQTPAGPST